MTLLCLLSALALAQSGVEVPDLDAQILRPTVDAPTFVGTDDAVRARSGTTSGRALLQLLHEPLVFQPAAAEAEAVKFVRDAVFVDLLAGYALGPARLGVDVPIIAYASSDVTRSETGLGDLALDLKLGGRSDAARLPGGAVTGRLVLPTATVRAPLGSRGVAGEIAVVGDLPVGPLLLAGNVGAWFQPTVELPTALVDEQLTWRMGASWTATDDAGGALEAMGRVRVGSELDASATPVEALATGWWDIADRVRLRAGFGVGLTLGIGAPAYRLLIAVGPAPERDWDDDGMVTPADMCPYDAEDVNGVRDEDGCPEDARVLAQDDGVVAVGLPALVDPDGDGLTSQADACPDEAEDVDDFEDGDGCPESDNDADGVLDADDRCPNVAETVNGFEDDDGCPEDLPDALAAIAEGIYFDSDRDEPQSTSVPILRLALEVLQRDRSLHVRVEGHTDSEGSAAYNQDLARRRARAVGAWLVEHGIDPDRIDVAGFGAARPAVPNATPLDRAMNRRVELTFWSVSP